MLEVHTTKSLSWFFIILSGLALLGTAGAALYDGELSLIAVALMFTVGLAVGLYTLLRPRMLLRLDAQAVSLFPGTLWGNVAWLVIPREQIRSLSAEEEYDGEGTFRVVRLMTPQPLTLSGSASRWATAARGHSRFRDDSENTIIWPLHMPNLSVAELNSAFADYLSEGMGNSSGIRVATATPTASH